MEFLIALISPTSYYSLLALGILLSLPLRFRNSFDLVSYEV
jgi:hypothetical protein